MKQIYFFTILTALSLPLSLILKWRCPSLPRSPKWTANGLRKRIFLNFLSLTSSQIAYRKVTDPNDLLVIEKKLNQCQEKIETAQLQGCFQNLTKFVHSYGRHHSEGHNYGLLISDKEYVTSPKYRRFLTLPKEFQDGLPDDWEEIAKANNWKYAEFTSSTVGNKYYGSHRRLTFLIQTPEQDQWVQFTTPEKYRWNDSVGLPERLINMITVEKKAVKEDGTSEALEEPRLYFSEFARNLRGRNPQLHTNVSSCYE